MDVWVYRCVVSQNSVLIKNDHCEGATGIQAMKQRICIRFGYNLEQLKVFLYMGYWIG